SMPYFRQHPDHCGCHRIPDDPLERSVCWALVRGRAHTDGRTILLIHHYDTADIEDYGLLRAQAYSPRELAQRMTELAGSSPSPYSPDALADLASGDWMFGRGGCDMKGGGAIEMALLEQYAQREEFSGNLLLLAVPDEENLSAGMRGATALMHQLKEEFDLDYQLLLLTEPHTREAPDTGTLYEGSVGKIMPLVYVKGQSAHVGQVFGGFNPILLLAEIVKRTELNPEFLEQVGAESTLPPVWLNMKDRKYHYDVSLPLAAAGYLSILTLEKTPGEHLARLKRICQEAFAAVISQMNTSHAAYTRNLGQEPMPLPWVLDVRTFDALEATALAHSGASYRAASQAKRKELQGQIAAHELGFAEAGFRLIELALAHSGITTPVVVIALSPPYYPSVSNRQMRAREAEQRAHATAPLTRREPFLSMAGLGDALRAHAKATWGQDYRSRDFFTGLSDLSYAIDTLDPEAMAFTQRVMPLWGDIYSIPFDLIRELSVPVINVGPWGKDFHKNTERVYIPDLCQRTPALIEEAIRFVFSQAPH
ncbi:MAG: M20/M25/M40 family metallo-hydrolase, partial [Holophaga sp.]|nr:M20/M25/M40 family metallo-hydrolase [Holophaga sp.]